MAAMFGWLSAANVWASRVNRASLSWSRATASGRIFSATFRCSRRSRARYTSPIPPAPSRSTTSYGPTCWPGERPMSDGDYIAVAWGCSRIEEGGGRSLVHDGQRTDVGDSHALVDLVNRVVQRPELDDLARDGGQEAAVGGAAARRELRHASSLRPHRRAQRVGERAS